MNDEFFSLPLFPPATLCDEDALTGSQGTGVNCGNCANRGGGCCNRCCS